MKKNLTNPTLTNELREGSAFFRRPTTESEEVPQSPAIDTPGMVPAAGMSTALHEQDKKERAAPTQAGSHDVEMSRNRDAMTSRYHDRLIEDIRKAVKVVGREPGTIRLTEQEKSQLTDIIYTLGRQGTRTSENEVYRIAIDYLLEDWREHGKESMLARVLAALQA